MNLRFVKSFSLAIGVTCAMSQGFCETDLDTRVSRLESDMKKVRGQTAFENYGAKTASAAPQTNGYGFFATGDFLWWKLYEFQDDYVYKNKTPLLTLPFKGEVSHMNFEWEPGFRLGSGYVFDYDGWDVAFHFTDFETHAHHTKKANSDGYLVPIWGFRTVALSKIKAKWDVHFYDLDLLLGRNYFVSRYFSLHPFIGLATAWINQHRSSKEYLSGVIAKLHGKNNFWGIGPRMGVNTQFFLGRHFSLYADMLGSLLWGDFKVHEKQRVTSPSFAIYNEQLSTHRMVPMVAYALGGSFETNFNSNRNHFMVKLGFENQYWWKQNQLPVIDSLILSKRRASDDLSMMGLTLDFRIDY